MCHYTSNKVRTGADRIGVTRRVAARRVARMSQLRYQAYCLSMSVFARIGPTVDRGLRAGRATLTGTWIWLVITRYLPSRIRPLHLHPLAWYPARPSSLCGHFGPAPARRRRDPVHVQVVIKITCARTMSFGDPRTSPEGLHGCKLDRHLHQVNCETVLLAINTSLKEKR